jgi:hypothetical protein
MRALALGFGFLLLAWTGCSNDAQPIDAAVEKIIPADLGQSCGAPAGCFTVVSSPGGRCQERCVTLGLWDAICSSRCLTNEHCGPGAPYCTPFGTGNAYCMAMQGDPNAGCLPDAGFDAPTIDAPMIDAGIDAAVDASIDAP